MTVRMRSADFRKKFSSFGRERKPLIKPESEDAYQAELVKWAKDAEPLWPELFLLYAIPNGANKSKAVRALMWLTGLKPGVPDLCLPVARKGYHGLYIEMKSKIGKLSPEQKIWIQKLTEQGYLVVTCNDPEDGKQILRDYVS